MKPVLTINRKWGNAHKSRLCEMLWNGRMKDKRSKEVRSWKIMEKWKFKAMLQKHRSLLYGNWMSAMIGKEVLSVCCIKYIVRLKKVLILAGVWHSDVLRWYTDLHGVRLQCLCIKMFCLHGSAVLYRYRNETDGAMTAEMEDGVATTKQSTQWWWVCHMRRDTQLW